jgi:hypothetical protein
VSVFEAVEAGVVVLREVGLALSDRTSVDPFIWFLFSQ